jgi:hypothetical protein
MVTGNKKAPEGLTGAFLEVSVMMILLRASRLSSASVIINSNDRAILMGHFFLLNSSK